MSSQKESWVYMIRCGDNSLYTGWTDNLKKRVEAHRCGKGAKYTKAKKFVELAWTECQPDPSRSAGQKREAEIKALSKREKEKLAAEWKAKIKIEQE